MSHLLDVCICTHNPRRDILDLVLQSLARQTASRALYRVLLVDNCSVPALDARTCSELWSAGVSCRLTREPLRGISHARARAIADTHGQWLLFVDDDNELAPDYIATGLEIMRRHEDLGCFGGKLVLPAYLQPPPWMSQLLPFLGIKDHGDEPIVRSANHWGPWEPPTAGAFIHRSLLDLYLRKASTHPEVHRLGRKGGSSLSSCEDSLIMRGAFELGRSASYQPRLVLHHHLDPRRFGFSYLSHLMYAYGQSHVVLESILGTLTSAPAGYVDLRSLATLVRHSLATSLRVSVRHALCMTSYHFGAYSEWRQRRASACTRDVHHAA